MPVCRRCSVSFEGPYRMKYCGLDCQFDANAKLAEGLTDEDCWEWNGARQRAGYGAFNNGKMIFSAHRYAAKRAFGDFDGSLFVCHKCDNPSCINPAHLFLGTHDDNAADMGRKGRAAWSNKKMPTSLREKMSAAHKGVPLSAKHRASLAAATKKRFAENRSPRIASAKELLMQGLQVKEVAEKMGLGKSLLHSDFRISEGMTPKQWRIQQGT